MSAKLEKSDRTVNNMIAKTEQEMLMENFSNIKLLLKRNKKFTNNPLLKTLSFFTENDIPLDIDAFWLDSYIEICDSKEAIKREACYLLLVDLFKSSMIDALYHSNSIDEKTRKEIIKKLKSFGLESAVEEEPVEEQTKQSVNHSYENVEYQNHSNEEELYF